MLEGTNMLYDSIIVTLILVVDAVGLYLLHKKEVRREQQHLKRVVGKLLKELHHGSRT